MKDSYDVALEFTEKSIKEIEALKRRLIDNRLTYLSPDQQDFFYRMFPDGVKENQLMMVLGLLDRTIKKNFERAIKGYCI